jgi:hypothetical protein
MHAGSIETGVGQKCVNNYGRDSIQLGNASHTPGGVLDVKKMGRALSRTGELFSGVEKWISGRAG